jgi:hypothetical protein
MFLTNVLPPQDCVLDKNRTMDDVQKHNICTNRVSYLLEDGGRVQFLKHHFNKNLDDE